MRNNPIAWMANNHVAANLLMLVFIVGGVLIGLKVKQEVFPETDLDIVEVRVPYHGASPEEIESGIILKIEENLSSIDGVKKITSVAAEDYGSVMVEILEGEDVDLILQDVKSEVDRIQTFPEDAEKPVISKRSNRIQVLSVAVYGNLSEIHLRERVETVREDLLSLPEITQVDLSGVRPYEISIEVAEEALVKYGLTLDQIAELVRKASTDLPAGAIKTQAGEILLRGKDRKYTGPGYASIVVVTLKDGTKIRLADIAVIKDGFEETDTSATFDGYPAAIVNVYRVGDQSPITISKAVREYVAKQQKLLPEGIYLATWFDRSEIFAERLELLLKNSYQGLILVLIILSIFLELRLAFWVSLGIPISFLGALFLMPAFDVSINMISLFAFIMALGIVVDDAIIIGENIYAHRRLGKTPLQASIDGTLEVIRAVTFSILTTIAAFVPLFFIGGMIGKFISVIPAVIISILTVSMIEAFFILPAHLSGLSKKEQLKQNILRRKVSQTLDAFIKGPYLRILRLSTRFRYVTIAVCLATAILTSGLYFSGVIKFRFFPDIEGDAMFATLKLPYGTPVEETRRYQQLMLNEAKQLIQTYDAERTDGRSILRNIFAIVGGTLTESGLTGSQGNICQVLVYLHPLDIRKISTFEFIDHWREQVGEIPGAESLEFTAELHSFGANINIRLSHDDFNILQLAGERLKKALAEYEGVKDIADSYDLGKAEWTLRLTPEAQTLGITELDLARQVRAAFHGVEALRFQRGRNEVKVMVRYPEKDRRNRNTLDHMRIRTKDGGEIPFHQAAALLTGRGYSSINRTDRKRALNVIANATAKANPKEILDELQSGLLQQLAAEYPGLFWAMEGEAEEQSESIESMKTGFSFALFIIYVLMAIPFKSYVQPAVVMCAIPFGFVGAVWGHILMGYNISIMSLFGIVALTGVVVNDSLVLLDFINHRIREGMDLRTAVEQGAQRRFRPIILTSLTTFCGLLPIMSETSLQAKFLIPMAISLAYGILFATVITLVMVPSLFLIQEDMKKSFKRIFACFSKTASNQCRPHNE